MIDRDDRDRPTAISFVLGPRLAKQIETFYEAFEVAYGQRVKKSDFLRYAINLALDDRDRTMEALSKRLI